MTSYEEYRSSSPSNEYSDNQIRQKCIRSEPGRVYNRKIRQRRMDWVIACRD